MVPSDMAIRWLALSLLLSIRSFAAGLSLEDEAELIKFGQNPAIVRIISSAEICYNQKIRREALAKIAKEKKYSRIGGVVFMRRIGELQDEIKEADDRIGVGMTFLKNEKIKPLPCSTQAIKELLYCKDSFDSDERLEECSGIEIKVFVELLRREHETVSSKEEE